MSRVRVGVIGLNFGRHHVRTLANMEDAQVVAVADRDMAERGELEAFASKYGAAAYRDGLEMMEKASLDAVCIGLPPHIRPPLIEYAARRRIPLFVEKPWSTDLVEGRRLAALCRQAQAPVMVGLSFRFLPAITRLRALLDGDLGAGWLLNGEYLFDWRPSPTNWLWDPKGGNGFFNENSCHLFDAVCHLLGSPLSVYAEGATFCDSPGAEVAAVTLRFPNQVSAALTLGCLGASAFQQFPRIDLVTANGQAHLAGRGHIWESLTWATRADTEVHTYAAAPEVLGSTRYTAAWQHFLDCIRSGSTPAATPEDGLQAVAIAMAVNESLRSGQRVMLDTLLHTDSTETGDGRHATRN